MDKEYIKSTEKLPKELVPVWARVCGHRPRKMYRVGNTFFYYNKTLSHMYATIGISEILWRYCNK